MRDHADLLEWAGLYGLGVLDAEERQELELHLADGCETCSAALQEAGALGEDLPLALEPVAASDTTRARLLERARDDAAKPGAIDSDDARRHTAPRSGQRWRDLALAASVLLAVGAGLQAWRALTALDAERTAAAQARSALDHEREERVALSDAFAALQDREQSLQDELTRLDDMVGAVTAPDARMVVLAGQGPTPDARARAFLDPDNGRLVLTVYALPKLPPGQTYQLWVIVDAEPVDAGVFALDAGGEARLDAENLPGLGGSVTVAVTIEPEGGVPKPTGPIVLAGT